MHTLMFKRIVVLVFIYLFWHVTQKFLSTDVEAKDSIVDRLHDTNTITILNNYLSENPKDAAFHFIISSLLIDINITYIAYMYLKKNKFKPIFILFAGLALRQLCQYINRLPIPNGMVWFDPGFPSLLVTYTVENDFFFSGHTYASLCAGIELVKNKKNIFISFYGLFFILYEIMLIVSIKGHYFMDIYGAFATYFMLSYFFRSIKKFSK
ncbi:hypothetical protein QJ857_gp0763 [Tupanvirus soda lake]|uniref:AtPDCT1/2 transmembrane domain-containing protein n=2 Tax=Tupanvirus TaxID=2094720 RepID=A0A6N1NL80_9VIRU|nr:hypothetical protein QJ857_gp0763 [Tupanvirus soda lake]QKU35285.1 hypothetical protein [Tupanvirus soda lake]